MKGGEHNLFGEHNAFVESFLSHRTRNFVQEPFCLSEIFWHGKQLWIRGGEGDGVTRTSWENFLSHNTKKILQGNTSMVRKISGI